MRNIMSAALIAAGALLGWSGGAVAAADSVCTNFGGSLQDDQTCNVHSSTPTYTLNMTFPVDYPDQALIGFPHAESRRLRQRCADVVAVFRTARRALPNGSHLRAIPFRPAARWHPKRCAEGLRRSRWPAPVDVLQGLQLRRGRSKGDHLRHAFRAEYQAARFDLSRSCNARWGSRPDWAPRYRPAPVWTLRITKTSRSPTKN